MHLGKTQIRLSMLVVSVIALGTALVSFSYLNRMKTAIDLIAYQDAPMAQLGESISLKMLEARREEKNFIIYLEPSYLTRTREIVRDLRHHVNAHRIEGAPVTATLDSIQVLLRRYDELVNGMSDIYQEDPNTFYKLQSQLLDYEQSLKNLANRKKLPEEDLTSWLSTLNISLVSANAKISAGKARHFAELKSISESVVSLGQQIAANAQQGLARHTREGLKYSIRSQRNTLMLVFVSAVLLLILIVWLPNRVFKPYALFIKSLQVVGRISGFPIMPHTTAENEVGDLSRAISAAMHECKVQSDLKTSKIQSIQRMHRRLLDEVNAAVFILDPDLIVLFMNMKAMTWFNPDSDDSIQKINDLPQLWADLETALENIDRSGRVLVKLTPERILASRREACLIPVMREGAVLEYVLLIIH